MTSRKQFFKELRELINSAESNLDHGRRRIGERKIMLAYRLLGNYGVLAPLPTFQEPCRFGGFCTDKKQYENCINDSRMKNNWMCWRDGILLEDKEEAAG